MSKFEKDVQGLALYIELRRPNATIQTLIVPEGFTNTEGVVKPVFFRRALSAGVTKRKWRGYNLNLLAEAQQALQAGTQLSDELLDEQVSSRMRNLNNYFTSAISQGYKLVNQPIYVEVTKEDIELARKGTLSTKLWTRVKSSRLAMGYPEETTSPASLFEAMTASI